jgi:hypothetical protein
VIPLFFHVVSLYEKELYCSTEKLRVMKRKGSDKCK